MGTSTTHSTNDAGGVKPSERTRSSKLYSFRQCLCPFILLLFLRPFLPLFLLSSKRISTLAGSHEERVFGRRGQGSCSSGSSSSSSSSSSRRNDDG